MKRFLCLTTLAACTLLGQSSASSSLETAAKAVAEKTAEWDKLAQALDASIARLLPCDPKGPEAIEQVSRASEARLAAVADFMQAARKQTAQDQETASRALSSGALLSPSLAAHTSAVAQDQAAVEAELTALTESLAARPFLDPPKAALQDVRADLRKEADAARAEAGNQEGLTASLRDFVAAATAREMAWKDLQAAYEAEGLRWKAYYTARLARAQAECSIIRGPAPVRPAPIGKQK